MACRRLQCSYRRLTVFVGIAADRGHPVYRKVEIRQAAIRPFQERHKKASQTTIHMQSNLVLLGQLTKIEDGIDSTVREVWCRSDKHDGVRITERQISATRMQRKICSRRTILHCPSHPVHIRLSRCRVYGYHMKLYLEIVGRFPKGSMGGSRDDSE